jgi:HEPN domain-containing protein
LPEPFIQAVSFRDRPARVPLSFLTVRATEAVKAVHLARGQEAWGHVVARPLLDLPFAVDPGLVDKAKVLDNFYVPARYPSGHPEGAPFEHFGPIQSGEAIKYAGEILEFARSQMAR